MAKKFNMPTRIILVEWLDACSDDRGWKTWKKLQKQAPVVIYSAGYVVKDDPEFVTVAGSICELDGMADGDVTIPRAFIRKVTELGPKQS